MVYIPPVNSKPFARGQDELLKPDTRLNTVGNEVASIYPVFGTGEDLILGLLKPVFEPMGVTVFDQHVKDVSLPLILARTTRASGRVGNLPDDPRFVRSLKLQVTAIMDGVNADRRCSELLEAVQHVIFKAWHEGTVVPGAGHIAHFDSFTEPSRVTDFQTATDIVQYASLPRGDVRYEQTFNVLVRPDNRRSGNEFVKQLKN